MDLQDLHQRVTAAILRAEGLPPGSEEASIAFRAVADLEERIAEVAPGDTLPGEAARLGAVTAAMSAGDMARAVQLADRYIAEGLKIDVRARLIGLRYEAREALSTSGSPG
jgi:hypothetical protein